MWPSILAPVIPASALVICAAQAPADDRGHCAAYDGSVIAVAIVAPLWETVRLELGVSGAAPPPVACLVPSGVIVRLKSQDPGLSGNALQALALYDRLNALVLIAAPWDASDTVDRSVLLHELVHHAQALLGRRHPCQGGFEYEAYALQEAWLEARGLDLEASIGLDPLARILLSTCGI